MNDAAETCRKIDNSLMMSLHDLEEKHVTQIQAVHSLSRRFKKFKKIRLGSKLLLSLIYGSGFRI